MPFSGPGHVVTVVTRYRSLELQLLNGTSDHNFTWVDGSTHNYFEDGGIYSHPIFPIVHPKRCTVVKVSNRSWCFTGVKGAIAFQIDDTNKYLVIGFRNSVFPYLDILHVAPRTLR